MEKISSHGGKRTGAGRKTKPKINYDEKFKKEVLAALRKLKRTHRASFLEKVFEMMYDDKVQDTVKASLFKSYKEIFVTKTTDTKVEVSSSTGPGILLPQNDQDPSEKIG